MIVNYYKIDKDLPDIVCNENHSGIDLYVREDTVIQSSLNMFSIVKQNILAMDNKPIIQHKVGLNYSLDKNINLFTLLDGDNNAV